MRACRDDMVSCPEQYPPDAGTAAPAQQRNEPHPNTVSGPKDLLYLLAWFRLQRSIEAEACVHVGAVWYSDNSQLAALGCLVSSAANMLLSPVHAGSTKKGGCNVRAGCSQKPF